MSLCQNCGYNNLNPVQACAKCGAALMGVVVLAEKASNAITERVSAGISILAADLELVMKIGSDQISMPFPPGSELLFGRYTQLITRIPAHDQDSEALSFLKGEPLALNKPLDFLSLASFGGIKAGVSRRHACIQRDRRLMTITDLKSTNGTYLNDERLSSHEKRLLRDGDEVRMGLLSFRISIRHRQAQPSQAE